MNMNIFWCRNGFTIFYFNHFFHTTNEVIK
ncbi:Uncharacterised protein [Serratia quinivorans]|nr:Uncharacterised protein [Serratia quinivorans]